MSFRTALQCRARAAQPAHAARSHALAPHAALVAARNAQRCMAAPAGTAPHARAARTPQLLKVAGMMARRSAVPHARRRVLQQLRCGPSCASQALDAWHTDLERTSARLSAY